MKKRSEFLDIAEKYLGVPYVWGGTRNSGMDCSGYVYRVLSDMGVYNKRLTAQGYYNTPYTGNIIGITECKIGDLLFFGSSTHNITHIAFYINNYQMLESGGGDSSNTINNPGIGVRYRDIRNDLVACKKVPYTYEIKNDGGCPMVFDVGQIELGDHNSDVLLLQEILKSRGYYNDSLDWNFGINTMNALINYQNDRKKQGIILGDSKGNPDGVCGEKTWNDLLAT